MEDDEMTKKQKVKIREQKSKYLTAMEKQLAECVARRRLATRMMHIAG